MSAPLDNAPEQARALRHTLVQQWNVPLAAEDGDWATFEAKLGERVQFLMEHDLNRLLTALYLLDVPEEAYNRAMRAPRAGCASKALARAILKREWEKMETRERYRRG